MMVRRGDAIAFTNHVSRLQSTYVIRITVVIIQDISFQIAALMSVIRDTVMMIEIVVQLHSRITIHASIGVL